MKKLMSLILFFIGIFYFVGAFGDPMMDPDPKRACPGSCFTTCPTICTTNNNTSCCPTPCPCPAPCPCPSPVFCQDKAFGGAFSFDANGNVTTTNSSAFSVTSVAPQAPDLRTFRVTLLTPLCLVGGVTANSDNVTNPAAVRAVVNNSFVVGLPLTIAGTVNFVVAPGACN